MYVCIKWENTGKTMGRIGVFLFFLINANRLQQKQVTLLPEFTARLHVVTK